MAAPTTLADVLIEAGFEPEMARRVTEVIEQDLTGLARQAELDIRLDKIDDRFDRVDERFDRFEVEINGRFDVIDARLDGVDKELKATNQRIDDLKDSVDRSLAAQTASIDRSLAGHKESIDRSLADHKESTAKEFEGQRREIRVVKWAIGIGIAVGLGGAAAIIALLIELFSRLP